MYRNHVYSKAFKNKLITTICQVKIEKVLQEK